MACFVYLPGPLRLLLSAFPVWILLHFVQSLCKRQRLRTVWNCEKTLTWVRWIVFHPDITEMVDWALKNTPMSYLPTYLPTYPPTYLPCPVFGGLTQSFLVFIMFTCVLVHDFRPDITVMVDWALKINYLVKNQLSCFLVHDYCLTLLNVNSPSVAKRDCHAACGQVRA